MTGFPSAAPLIFVVCATGVRTYVQSLGKTKKKSISNEEKAWFVCDIYRMFYKEKKLKRRKL
jgi:hypothetical protein